MLLLKVHSAPMELETFYSIKAINISLLQSFFSYIELTFDRS